jgi:hypothetical protein
MLLRAAAATLVALSAACSAIGPDPVALDAALATAPAGEQPRLWLDGDRLIGAAVPCSPIELPPAVRTMLAAIAPDGEQEFVARELGPRGAGFRIDVRYQDPPHVRSLLLAADGSVLERSHTVATIDAPEHVLAAGLRHSPLVDAIRMVSGPEREEYWELVVRERSGGVHVIRVGLDGTVLGSQRRFTARVDR